MTTSARELEERRIIREFLDKRRIEKFRLSRDGFNIAMLDMVSRIVASLAKQKAKHD